MVQPGNKESDIFTTYVVYKFSVGTKILHVQDSMTNKEMFYCKIGPRIVAKKFNKENHHYHWDIKHWYKITIREFEHCFSANSTTVFLLPCFLERKFLLLDFQTKFNHLSRMRIFPGMMCSKMSFCKRVH